MRRRWVNRLGWVVGALALSMAPMGCGSAGLSLLTGDPPGRLIAGTGAVADAAGADLRVLLQYLGLTAGRQEGPTIGTGSDPLRAAYRLHDGLTPADTEIRPFFDEATYRLNTGYFVYFVDPTPNALFGHTAFYLYLRPADGAMFEQSVDAFPVVNGEVRLQDTADRLDHLVYVHEFFQDHIGVVRQVEPPHLIGSETGALILCSAENERQADIDNAAEYLQDLTGEANPLSVLWDKHPDGINRQAFIDRLQATSAGLGADDKYLLVLATHGARPPKSRFQIGTEVMTYEELCEALQDNVTAGHINVISGTCFGGQMHDVFLGWDAQTTKEVRWFTSASNNVYSYYDPPGIWGLKCAFDKLTMELQEARSNGVVTLAEIEQAMAGLELTGAEILQKMCDYAEETWGTTPSILAWKANLMRDDGPTDDYPPPGDPRTGGFPGERPPFGELEIPEEFQRLEFDFGGGTGFLGSLDVNLEDGQGGIDTGLFGLQFAPFFLEINSTIRLQTEPAGFGTIHLQGPVIQLNGLDGDDQILLRGEPPVPIDPAPSNDSGERIWAVRHTDTFGIELLFPRRRPDELAPNTTPLVSRLGAAPLHLIGVGPAEDVARQDLLGNTRSMLAVVNGGLVPPSGSSQLIDQGLLLVIFNPQDTHELAALATFDLDGQQCGLFWQTTLATQTAPIPGDYDGDADVDASDYLAWQRFAAQPELPSNPADLNNNGVVDAADYTVWRDHFTGSSP